MASPTSNAVSALATSTRSLRGVARKVEEMVRCRYSLHTRMTPMSSGIR